MSTTEHDLESKLHTAIDDMNRSDFEDDRPLYLTHWITIAAYQLIDEDGDPRTSYIYQSPAGQPWFMNRGLVAWAAKRLDEPS